MGDHHRPVTAQAERPQSSKISTPPAQHRQVDTLSTKAKVASSVPGVVDAPKTAPQSPQAHTKVGPAERSGASKIAAAVSGAAKAVVSAVTPKPSQTPVKPPATAPVAPAESADQKRARVSDILARLASEEGNYVGDKGLKAAWTAQAIYDLSLILLGRSADVVHLANNGSERNKALEALRTPMKQLFRGRDAYKGAKPAFLASLLGSN